MVQGACDCEKLFPQITCCAIHLDGANRITFTWSRLCEHQGVGRTKLQSTYLDWHHAAWQWLIMSIVSELVFFAHMWAISRFRPSMLQVMGAGGHSVLYLGVMPASTLLPKVIGVDGDVNTLFLICLDTDYSSRVPVIAGCNILSVCTACHAVWMHGGVEFHNSASVWHNCPCVQRGTKWTIVLDTPVNTWHNTTTLLSDRRLRDCAS